MPADLFIFSAEVFGSMNLGSLNLEVAGKLTFSKKKSHESWLAEPGGCGKADFFKKKSVILIS